MIQVKARAGGSRNAVTGVTQGALRVVVTQVPEGGKANAAITEVLAQYFGCSKSRVQLIGGGKMSQKRFLLVGWSAEEVLARHLDQY